MAITFKLINTDRCKYVSIAQFPFNTGRRI